MSRIGHKAKHKSVHIVDRWIAVFFFAFNRKKVYFSIFIGKSDSKCFQNQSTFLCCTHCELYIFKAIIMYRFTGMPTRYFGFILFVPFFSLFFKPYKYQEPKCCCYCYCWWCLFLPFNPIIRSLYIFFLTW